MRKVLHHRTVMPDHNLISIIESPMHPNYSALYARKSLVETKVTSIRKAINLSKRLVPAIIVAEFFYAYSTNYSGIHKSNLDVLLVSLAKYSPESAVIALGEKEDARHFDALDHLNYPHLHCLVHPSKEADVASLLDQELQRFSR